MNNAFDFGCGVFVLNLIWVGCVELSFGFRMASRTVPVSVVALADVRWYCTSTTVLQVSNAKH